MGIDHAYVMKRGRDPRTGGGNIHHHDHHGGGDKP